MRKGESIYKLSDTEFRRLTGIKKLTFETMKKILEAADWSKLWRKRKCVL